MRSIILFVVFLFSPIASAAPGPPAPPLSSVIEAARQAQGLDGPLDRWSDRARWRAVLPRVGGWIGGDSTDELDLTFRESTGVIDEGVLIVDGTQNTTEDDRTQKLSWRLSATWDLREAIFSSAELAAAHEARARQVSRIRLDLRVVELYRMLGGPDHHVAAQELDVLTGGWYARQGGAR